MGKEGKKDKKGKESDRKKKGLYSLVPKKKVPKKKDSLPYP